jgi:hypothetical protein
MAPFNVRVHGALTDEARSALKEAGMRVSEEPVEGTERDEHSETGFPVTVDADDATEARHKVGEALDGLEGFSIGEVSTAS